jgi:hypothetical protein
MHAIKRVMVTNYKVIFQAKISINIKGIDIA